MASGAQGSGPLCTLAKPRTASKACGTLTQHNHTHAEAELSWRLEPCELAPWLRPEAEPGILLLANAQVVCVCEVADG